MNKRTILPIRAVTLAIVIVIAGQVNANTLSCSDLFDSKTNAKAVVERHFGSRLEDSERAFRTAMYDFLTIDIYKEFHRQFDKKVRLLDYYYSENNGVGRIFKYRGAIDESFAGADRLVSRLDRLGLDVLDQTIKVVEDLHKRFIIEWNLAAEHRRPKTPALSDLWFDPDFSTEKSIPRLRQLVEELENKLKAEGNGQHVENVYIAFVDSFFSHSKDEKEKFINAVRLYLLAPEHVRNSYARFVSGFYVDHGSGSPAEIVQGDLRLVFDQTAVHAKPIRSLLLEIAGDTKMRQIVRGLQHKQDFTRSKRMLFLVNERIKELEAAETSPSQN